MKQINYASENDVKRLLLIATENRIDVVFCDPENKCHQEWRTECIQHDWAKIYQDMDLPEIKRELECVLRGHGIEPNKRTFEDLKAYCEPLKERATLKKLKEKNNE